ncbi:CotD family spore coat protein [Bacillus fonticola]|uniref:CotD family spore coat protein n=1 Tax=Bacillus fonticola TaxID=2728853 RepID=UPI001474F991|nr:CotD family spore coat protein [Bacillus fonticola]
MHCPKRPDCVMPPVVHPTKTCVNHTFSNTVVPHIHPQHNVTVNHQNYQHNHYFPQSQSVAQEVTNQQNFYPPGSAPYPYGR